jgi:hypothetical protein
MLNFADTLIFLSAMNEKSPNNPTDISMLTDLTEAASLRLALPVTAGFTQAWDTVGAGT